MAVGTGTAIDLSQNGEGYYYNMVTPLAATSYSTNSLIAGGFAVVKSKSTTTEPAVTNGGGSVTKVFGSEWVVNVDMYIYIYTFDGTNIFYYWLTENGDVVGKTETIGVTLSGTEDLTTGTVKWGYDMPFDFTVLRVYATLITAPTGSSVQIDINDEGVSLLNSVLSIAVSTNNAETTSFSGATNSYDLSKNDHLSYDIDQIGSTIAGAGLTVFMEGIRT